MRTQRCLQCGRELLPAPDADLCVECQQRLAMKLASERVDRKRISVDNGRQRKQEDDHA